MPKDDHINISDVLMTYMPLPGGDHLKSHELLSSPYRVCYVGILSMALEYRPSEILVTMYLAEG